LFYPPNCAFVLSALGVVALVLVMSELSSLWTSLKWFQLFGSMTLAMYLLHLLIIGHILENLFYPIPSMASFFAIYAGHLVVLTLGAY
jgi:fucose 4-O-acetylase-like acetyltransferase